MSFIIFRSLETARVTQWASMISTPNDDMLEGIKSSLTENGCPLHLATELIEKATEKHWPSGLSSLDARQLNREQCEKYVAKRIPGLFECPTEIKKKRHSFSSYEDYNPICIIFKYLLNDMVFVLNKFYLINLITMSNHHPANIL